MKSFKYLLLPAVSAMIMFSCSHVIDPDDPSHGNRYSAESNFSLSVAAAEMNKLTCNAINGAIKIVGQDNSDKVVLSGKKIVRSSNERDAHDYMQNIQVSIAQSGSSLIITSEQPDDLDGRDVNIDYDIQVPSSWALTVSSSNGGCTFEHVRGDLMSSLINGNIALSDIRANLYIRVTNGQIAGQVELPYAGAIDAQTTNGLIVIGFPQTTSAKLSAQVTNGTVNVSGLTLKDMYGSQREIHGTLGGGEGSIDLKTVNGNISISGY